MPSRETVQAVNLRVEVEMDGSRYA
jgi:hypothetical protein